MNNFKKFWEEVALDIEVQYQQGHPSTWKKSTIEVFLIHFTESLYHRCKNSDAVAEQLGLPKKNNQYQADALVIITSGTFRRIFVTKEIKNSSPTTRDHFAIYLDYDSYMDYILKKEIKEDLKIQDKVILLKQLDEIKTQAEVKPVNHVKQQLNGFLDKNHFLYSLLKRSNEYNEQMQIVQDFDHPLTESTKPVLIQMIVILEKEIENLPETNNNEAHANMANILEIGKLNAQEDIEIIVEQKQSSIITKEMTSINGKITIDIKQI